MPSAVLVDRFSSGAAELSLAAGRTCYSSKAIRPEDAFSFSSSTPKDGRDKGMGILSVISDAGHHTVIQHPHYVFLINASRHCVWSFLHSHPFYNSEQVSQRYVLVKPESFVIPPLEGSSFEIFESTVRQQMKTYEELIEILLGEVKKQGAEWYPAQKRTMVWDSTMHKASMESARYVLPVAAKTFLYHTISGLTLHRYRKCMNSMDTPLEARLLVEKMLSAVSDVDSDYARLEMSDSVPLEQTPEYGIFMQLFGRELNPDGREFCHEFDARLGRLSSKLVAYEASAEAVLAQSVRNIFGATSNILDDASAIELVLNPAKNNWLVSTLNVNPHTKLGRAMNCVHYTFEKKNSHTADSQDQRHRMVPGARPIIAGHYSSEPDCIWPEIFYNVPEALDKAELCAKQTWQAINKLLDNKVAFEFAQYLLPNATAIRFTESGSLLDWWHKWRMRLCYLAQKEIWTASRDEVLQVVKVHPNIGKYFGAPCHIRDMARVHKRCPEGTRFCGFDVWNNDLEMLERTL